MKHINMPVMKNNLQYNIPELFQPSTLLKVEQHNSIIDKQKAIFENLEKKLHFQKALHLSDYVHYQLAPKTPIQRWYPYREGFSVKLVDYFIKELDIKGNVFDPFSGSGTTLLSARNNNLQSFGVDINPISILISEVENEIYQNVDIEQINVELQNIVNSEFNLSHELSTNFELSKKVFNKEILQTLLHLKVKIKQIENSKIQKLFFVGWLSIIEQVSNVKKEGNGIKYKNRKRTKKGYISIDKEVWEKNNFPKDKHKFILNIFKKKIKLIKTDIEKHYGLIEKKPKIFNGDCTKFNDFFDADLELTFFSPPYCNSFDYFEIHKVELWLGDFVKNRKEFRELKNKGFRSNTNALNGKLINYSNPHIENLISLFNYDKLWNKKIPNVVRGYFDDMYQLLTKLFIQTQRNGYVVIVVGNSAYSGVIIPTDAIISEFAQEIGFSLENILITRHLTTSSQQKIVLADLKQYLRESIIILKK